MHKRGEAGEQMMFFVLITFMLVVGVGIVGGVVMFYGDQIDVRGEEAGMLSYWIERCLTEEDPPLREDIFYESCDIKKGSFEEKEIFFHLKSSRLIGGVIDEDELKLGSNFEACKFEGAKGNKHFPRCSSRKFSVGEEGAKIDYEIIVGSNHWNYKEVVKVG